METTLVDYSYGSSRIAPSRTSDMDFGDVFGGPPRKSSIHGSMRYSFTDGADSVAAPRRLGKTASFRDPWASTEQKPVFGGGVEGGSRRWSLQEEDFFVDIFGGSESLSSTTPRTHDGDAFSASSRGWRALSSALPLPPRVEGFVDPTSEPTQFSLPEKLSNPVDSPAFRSPARASYNDAALNWTTRLRSPKMSVFRFPKSRAVQVHNESGNNGPQHRPSTMSQRFSCGADDSLGLTKQEKMDDSEKHTGNPQDEAHSSRFHFLMYKWAGKAEQTTDNGCEVLGSPYATPINVNDRSDSDEVENHPLGNSSPKVEVDACQPARSALNDKDGKSSALSLKNSRESSEKEMNGGFQNTGTSDSKPLRAFFNNGGNGRDTIDGKTGETSRIGKGSSRIGNNIEDFKKMHGRKSEEAKKVTVEGSPWSLENGPGRNRPKGKFKEFIRIFSWEAHPGKPRTGIPSQDQNFTKKDNGASEATEEACVGRKAAVNDRASVFQLEKPRVHPEKVADPYEHSPIENSTPDSNDILFSDNSPGQKDSSASSTASITDDAQVTDEDADESSGTYFTVRELAHDENKQMQPTENCEEIQTTDAKIRQWSRGKEGNIRSLLSTLQYVLWPGSGWKPVPLVDIIEGTAVKRSYQKALLCLHPDKLQQKGAALDQKYIAEQVFEILQEAWTHFNALGLAVP